MKIFRDASTAARSMVVTVLAALSIVGTAEAAIDAGYNGYPRSVGVSDPVTGLTWIKATTLAEGQAQGYRAATAGEFRTLLTNFGWVNDAGAVNEYSLTTGATYTSGASPGLTQTTSNIAPVGFARYTVQQTAPFPGFSSVFAASMGWLDGVSDGQIGALFDRNSGSQIPSCYGQTGGCFQSSAYNHEALVANMADLKSGTYDKSSHLTGERWSTSLAPVTQADGAVSLQYFMVASVPEPSSALLMGLGVLGLLAVTRRRVLSGL